MDENLKNTAAKGLFWGGISNVTQQLLNLCFGIFLARLLDVSDYGMVGMLTIFSALANAIQEGGFRSAITNKKDVTDTDYNAVFWTSSGIGVLLYLTLFFTVPYIADFYNTPELVGLGRFMFLSFLFSSLGTAHNAYLFKNLKVKEMSKSTLTASLISGIVALTMAFNGLAYWGIAAMNVVYVFVTTVMFWFFSPFRPSFNISLKPVVEMLPFSIKLLITIIFQILNDNFFNVLLGRFYSKHDVGIYTQAYKWTNIGTQTISLAIENVMQPVLAKSDKSRLLQVFNKLMQTTVFISFPCMFGLGLIAPEFIEITIENKWAESADLMTVLCIWGGFFPFAKLFQKQILSSGQSGALMFCVIVTCILQIIVVCFSFEYGIKVMTSIYVAVNLLCMGFLYYFVHRINGVTIKDIFVNIMPFFVSVLIALFAAYFASSVFSNIYVKLVIKIIVTASVYFLMLKLMKSVVLTESLEFVKSLIVKKK